MFSDKKSASLQVRQLWPWPVCVLTKSRLVHSWSASFPALTQWLPLFGRCSKSCAANQLLSAARWERNRQLNVNHCDWCRVICANAEIESSIGRTCKSSSRWSVASRWTAETWAVLEISTEARVAVQRVKDCSWRNHFSTRSTASR